MKFKTLACILCCPLGLLGSFSISDRSILKDGEPFLGKGLCYQPTPIGQNPSVAPPYGDYYTSGYAALYERDLANMRRMGANLIRVYGWTTGADHSDFLDLAYNGGEESLYLLVNKWVNPSTNWSNTGEVQALKNDWVAMANEIKDHPAAMGILIGNEVDAQNGNLWNTDFWTAINEIAGAVKEAAPNLLVSTAITDQLGQVAARDAAMDNLDFWAIQVYRGLSFYSFFADYANASSKPLIITEFGFDAYNHNAGQEFADNALFSANAMETLWSELRDADVCSGGCVFEYSDEWWKSDGSAFDHDTGGWASGAWPDGAANEEWWGVFRVIDNGSAPDIMEPRAMFYRLAAMWNPPALASTGPDIVAGHLQMQFTYPDDLRDQEITIWTSPDLSNWQASGDNAGTTYPVSRDTALAVTSEVSGGTVTVTASQAIGSDSRVFLKVENSGK